MSSSTIESVAAARLNRECFCVGTDLPALHRWLEEDLAHRGLERPLVETHPHLFSALPVFLAREHAAAMQELIAAIETVIATPGYRNAALADAPPIASRRPAALGVLQSYDFHLGAEGPKLIEINTNAGGAMLNAVLGRAQRACCTEVRQLCVADRAPIETDLIAMFRNEWRLERGDAPLRRIAIVDDAPPDQYLFPEFLLFQRLFETNGIEAVVAATEELTIDTDRLMHRSGPIDLVYNRLTDFYFDEPRHSVLRAAYERGLAVVTPHPHDHALHANKRNLAFLSDATLLARLGAPDETVDILRRGVPYTEIVTPATGERLWRERKRLFFKPARGYGARGSYRGEKLTKTAFATVLAGDYVAQALVPPSERLNSDVAPTPVLKVDLRNYVYAGAVLEIAARLYQGQTTNFRTPGGGFAPVFHPSADGTCGSELVGAIR